VRRQRPAIDGDAAFGVTACIAFERHSDNVKREDSSASYLGFIGAACSQTLTLMLRRKRVILVGAVTLVPVLVPLAAAFLNDSQRIVIEGNDVFVKMVEYLYLKALAPLLALFFGCMVIGEEVESDMMPYVLTRPTPRSAWILGKYAAYLTMSLAMLLTSIVLTFFACTSLVNFDASPDNLGLLVHYSVVVFVALLAYGAFCLCLGAVFKRSVIWGVVVLFGWQRLAAVIPGLVDYLTIEKYVNNMLPKLATGRGREAVRAALADLQRHQLLVDASKAGAALLIVAVVFLLLTILAVRRREFARSKTIGS